MTKPPAASPLAERYLRLHLCPDVGPIRFAALLRELGTIDAVLEASERNLLAVEGIGPIVARNILRGRDDPLADAEIADAQNRGIRILCIADPDYPHGLKNIADPPACIYLRGTLEPADALAIAIVGSRNCSRYGTEQAERFAALGASAGLTIVSGMARGIDAAAHRGALVAGGRTLAVMGCGLAHVYPPESVDLADQIAQHGALISELPIDTAPDAKNFPPRNRIIAGLSLGVLVVEAARRSGALITARLASEYNREVFAIPGRLDTLQAEGCADLIKTGAAKLVMGMGDILDELGEAGRALKDPALTVADEAKKERTPADKLPLSDSERALIHVLGDESMPVEEICSRSGLTPPKVAVALTQLELKGLIRRKADRYEPTT